MGVSVAEGTIVEWLKRPGDAVSAEETICEVSTDKIDVEIPAPAAGTIKRLLAEPGKTVAVGEPIAEIETAAGSPPAGLEDTAGNGDASGNGSEADRSGVYSPVVRRMAAEHGIDLETVRGGGVGGRVRKKDLLGHIGAGAKPSDRPLHIESPYRPDHPAPGDEDLRGPARREPMDPVRRATAEHMVASRRTAAHVTSVIEVDFSRIAQAEAAIGHRTADRGVKLTHLAFVAQATIAALADHPVLNASIEGEEVVYFADVNLGIAVATDGGLLVPVIRKAQRLSLEGIAAAIADAAGRARSGRLEPDDVHGGTFTITNPGRFGTVLGTPIINPPQVAILDLESITDRPVAVPTATGRAVAIRPIGNLCLSWDHRALDGAEAARFLGDVKARLESAEVPS
jgi:2-oxoglutarate dehydrogenase E2 component (dihydrolipoamide succinyltransferase)